MSRIPQTTYIDREGAVWDEPHWLEKQGLEDPLPTYYTIEIKDGTGQPRPWVVYVIPDRV